MMKKVTAEGIFKQYQKGYEFNSEIKLYDTVQVNEDFFVGNQWKGVEANGLPTPTFNLLKQVVNFQVATITSDNFKLNASPLTSVGGYTRRELESICRVVNKQYEAIIERNNIVAKMREFLRNAAVDGDGCMYFRFDDTIRNGQEVPGEIVAEITENTRVIFGNPNCRKVQKQPYIIISRRDLLDQVQEQWEDNREDGITDIPSADDIRVDDEIYQNEMDSIAGDKVTVLMYFWKDRKTGTVWYAEATAAGFLVKPRDTQCHLYPIVWLSWENIHDSYHGQSMITGLIPNQKFINKMFAMVGISLMTSSFPKIVFDRTKIKKWDSSIGSAVGVSGNVDGVAKIIQGAAVNPQIADFIVMALDTTKSLLGASDVALGDSRPDNTSAIIALQRAANTPMEMTKQSRNDCVEEMGQIWKDMMGVKYGTRMVEQLLPIAPVGEQPLGMQLPEQSFIAPFDFSILNDVDVTIKHDVGASSYWSEIASVQTIENLLMQDKITLQQFLERMPSGYIMDGQKLIDEIKGVSTPVPGMPGNGATAPPDDINDIPLPTGAGNGKLQRALQQTGV